jgi:hypothetical protein
MKCPSCHGAKQFLVICNGSFIPCFRCKASGRVPDIQKKWIVRGRKIRNDRVKRGVTLREEAKRRKLDVLALSEMERGVIDPGTDGKSK